jgi:DME family drug/metabolite transporter
VLWGTTGTAVQVIADRTGLAAVSIGFLRVLVATAALMPFLLRSRVRVSLRTLAHRRGPLVLSGVGFGAYQALYFVGVRGVGVSVSTLVSLAVAPVALTVGAALARRRVPAPSSLLVLGCALAGLALVSLRGGISAAPAPVIGVLASVGSGLGYAATTVLNRRLSDVGDPLVLTGATSLVATVVLLPFAVAAGLSWPADGVASWWLIYIGAVPTVLAYSLFYRGLRTTTAEVAGVLTLLEPLTAALLAAAVLHEQLSATGLVGAGLLLVALGVLYLRRPETAAADRDQSASCAASARSRRAAAPSSQRWQMSASSSPRSQSASDSSNGCPPDSSLATTSRNSARACS